MCCKQFLNQAKTINNGTPGHTPIVFHPERGSQDINELPVCCQVSARTFVIQY